MGGNKKHGKNTSEMNYRNGGERRKGKIEEPEPRIETSWKIGNGGGKIKGKKKERENGRKVENY